MSKEKYTIDFTNVNYYLEMHGVIWHALEFPDYYGCNWDAFWDCLTDMIGEKIHIQIVGIDELCNGYGDTADKMLEILQEFRHYCDDKFIDDIQIEIVNGDECIILQ